MAKVSVIIPTYNREEYICETIDSVLNQTYKDIEIVIVDDGSTDKTLSTIEKYKSNIKVIQQTNAERAIARNNGVNNSSGEYIAFLDSDDLWKVDKLEKQIKILNENENVVLVYSACNRVDENSHQIKTANRQSMGYSGKVFDQLLMRNFIASATPVVRRSAFEKTTGFNDQFVPYEDWKCWINLSLEGDFHFIEEPLAYYRVHSKQSVQNVNAEKIEKVTSDLLEDSYNLHNTTQEIINKSRALANLRYCYWYIINGQFDKARARAIKASKCDSKIRYDLRWLGLRSTCELPFLSDLFQLKKLHLTY